MNVNESDEVGRVRNPTLTCLLVEPQLIRKKRNTPIKDADRQLSGVGELMNFFCLES